MQHKKACVLLAVFLLSAGFLVFSLHARRDVIVQNAGRPRESETARTQSAVPQDSDTDGLNDAEELLYGTDPLDVDSDGDGTGDGEEVDTIRNPLHSGPDDALRPGDEQRDGIARGYAPLTLSQDINLTSSLVTTLLEKHSLEGLMNAKDGGEPLATLKAHLSPLSAKLPEFDENAVNESALAIREDSSNKSVRAYLNAVAEIYEKRFAALKNKDFEIITRALEEKSEKPLEKLAHYRLTIERGLSEIEKLPAPRAVLALHKKEIWYLRHTIAQVRLFEQATLNDPVRFLVLLDLRILLKNKMRVFHAEEVPGWLQSHAIALSENDKASLLYPFSPSS